ncbi:MAG TPA: membrane protein insertase YidC [Jiangellaceae bacterium]
MYSFPPLAAAIGGLYTVVTGLTTLLTPALGAFSASAAIILLTMGVRLLLVPLARRQTAADRRRRELAPKLREIQRRHRNDPERLRRELHDLYAREGTSPLAGFGPALAQAPVFIAMYGLFLSTDVGGHTNDLLTHTLFGVPLGARLFEVGGADLAVFAGLFLLLVLVAVGMWRLAGKRSAADAPGAAIVRLLPFSMVAVAAFVPLAAGLYLVATTAWTLAERTLLLS